MWRVVHFLQEETVAALPIQWVMSENACRWPTFTGLKLRTAISKCSQPDESWPIFECQLLGEIYGDLSTARMKAIQAEEESDLNSDAEAGFGRRKLIKNKRYDKDFSNLNSFHELRRDKKKNGNSEISDSEEENQEIHGSPEMPKMNRLSSNLGSNKMKDTIIECCTPVSSISESTKSIDIPIHINEEMSTAAHPVIIKEPDPSRVFAEETFRRQVLRQFSTINFKVDQLTEDVERLLRNDRDKNDNETIEESIFDKFDFPIKNIDELQKFEKYLEIGENKTKVVCELSKIGGSNHKVMTKRLLERLISNVLAMNYSWLGLKKKDNFSALILSSTVKESVMKIHRKITESDVELVIKGWLVKAKEREEKSQK
ncbi:uncharacterized protein LOC123321893 isoform X2 [Coccinella septempunctata]|uniref:uncharacterized protein LOC123321893 isoform X2 n=1 Tax=Coccinella septempunctata TaxID=41139 RepID=UPI001D076A2B|nr:uncharacterized protein LOC123321893 isoform X2 [Coccinella septempunctata]